MPLCLMILTDIIEFYKCLKSLSGATAPLNERKKEKEKEEVVGGGGGEITTRQNIPGGEKMFEKLLWESIKSAGSETSCRLSSASFSSATSLAEKEQKERNSREVRR